MKDHFISDLEPNQNITTTFLVKDKEVRTAKNGNSYLSLTLGDKSGSLDAKMWDNVAEVEPTFGRDDFVKVRGQVRLFNNRQQLTIHRIRRCRESEVDLGDYLPKTTRDVEQMFGDLQALVSRIGNPHLKRLSRKPLERLRIRRQVQTGARRQVPPSRLAGRSARTHLVPVPALPRDGRTLSGTRPGPSIDRSRPSRHRQDGRTELQPQLRLHHRGPTARPHDPGTGPHQSEDCRDRGFSSQAEDPGPTPDHLPPRRIRVRQPQAPHVPGVAGAPLPRQPGQQAGLHAGSDCRRHRHRLGVDRL